MTMRPSPISFAQSRVQRYRRASLREQHTTTEHTKNKEKTQK
jgi:hypothetical protein